MPKLKFLLALLLTAHFCSVAYGVDDLPIDNITLPDGFKISIVTQQVKNARQIAMSPKGTIYVGSREKSKNVYEVNDLDGDWVAESVEVIAKNLVMPSGVAFNDGNLYVADNNRILKFSNIETKNPPTYEVISNSLPKKKYHGWRYIKFGPHGSLYLPIGIPCDACVKGPPYGQMLVMDMASEELSVYAEGLRSVQGLDWHPETNELWFADNGRNHLGDEIPPDEINRISRSGMNFGAPFCHGGEIPDPDLGDSAICDGYDPPAVKLPAHVSPLGIQFYNQNRFPEEYRNRLFIAEHGSWDRSEPTGYRISTIIFDSEGNVLNYEIFAEGWLNSDGSYWGRPTDLYFAPDGSLLVSDDHAGAIYRISYH